MDLAWALSVGGLGLVPGLLLCVLDGELFHGQEGEVLVPFVVLVPFWLPLREVVLKTLRRGLAAGSAQPPGFVPAPVLGLLGVGLREHQHGVSY